MKINIGHSLHGSVRHISLFYHHGLYLGITDDATDYVRTWRISLVEWIKSKRRYPFDKHVVTGAFTLTTINMCAGGRLFQAQYADYPSQTQHGRYYPAHREHRQMQVCVNRWR